MILLSLDVDNNKAHVYPKNTVSHVILSNFKFATNNLHNYMYI